MLLHVSYFATEMVKKTSVIKVLMIILLFLFHFCNMCIIKVLIPIYIFSDFVYVSKLKVSAF